MSSPTREAWLIKAVRKLEPLFSAQGYELPACRISCGFASTGLRSGPIGQCWSRASAADRINQIFISPSLADPVEVLDTSPTSRRAQSWVRQHGQPSGFRARG